jgi:serine beta-lactamase-like protein LACTB, mitochondrial
MSNQRNSATSVCLQFILWLLLVVIFSSTALGQRKDLTPAQRAAVKKAVSAFIKDKEVPGVGVAIVTDGALVWSKGFGFADLENRAPATSSTLFRLGSISKSITATAILQLWERGKLDLDAPVQEYCPAFPQKEWPITSRQLLAHLGGIRHYNDDGKGDVPADSARHFSSMEESLQIFAHDALVAKPGAKFSYSTYGYTVLGCVLEGAASQQYMDYLRANVLIPAGMEQTRDDNFFAVIPHRTRWYHKEKERKVQNAGVLDSSYKIPGGGLISSADDMARFEIAILNGRLLKRASRDLMWTTVEPAEGKPTHYALGWFVRDEFGVKTIGHTGGQQGTDTTFLLVPDRGAGVVVLANIDGVNTTSVAEQILKITLGVTSKD